MSRFLTKSEIKNIHGKIRREFVTDLSHEERKASFSIYFDLNEFEDKYQLEDLLKKWKILISAADTLKVTTYCDKFNRSNDARVNRDLAGKRAQFIKNELESYQQKNGLSVDVQITPFDEKAHTGFSDSVIGRNHERRGVVEIILLN
jgi:outer membrane protein OmpA-like peptidoglycan-associated protein